MRAGLVAHGAHGFIGLQRKFRIMDDDGTKQLSMAEFKKGIKELGKFVLLIDTVLTTY